LKRTACARCCATSIELTLIGGSLAVIAGGTATMNVRTSTMAMTIKIAPAMAKSTRRMKFPLRFPVPATNLQHPIG